MSNNPKRSVLHIVGSSKFGGATNIILSLVDMARQKGLNAAILTDDIETIKVCEKLNIEIVYFKGIIRPVRPWTDFAAVYRLSRLLKKRKDSIVHTHTTKGGAIGRIAARLAGVPVVIHTVHGFSFHEFSSKIVSVLFGLAERILSKFCDCMIFVNNYDRELAIKRRIVQAFKAETIYNGLNAERIISNAAADRKKLLEEAGLKTNIFLSVFVGRLAKQKGLRYLFEAIKIVKQNNTHVDMHQIIIGDGPLRQECERWAQELDIAHYVHFLGFRTDAVKWTGIADLFVLSSLWEGHSVTLLEAMCLGKPIVATDIKGNRESINDASEGLLVAPADPRAFASAMLKLMENPDYAVELGRNAKEKFVKLFTVQQMLSQTWELYKAVAERKGIDLQLYLSDIPKYRDRCEKLF